LTAPQSGPLEILKIDTPPLAVLGIVDPASNFESSLAQTLGIIQSIFQSVVDPFKIERGRSIAPRSMNFRPPFPPSGYAVSQPPSQQQRQLQAAIYDPGQRVYFQPPPQQPFGRAQAYQPVYFYQQPYAQGKPIYPQESIVVMPANPEQLYAPPRPQPEPPFHTLHQPPNPPAPRPVDRRKPRTNQPPGHLPMPGKAVQPPPPAPAAPRQKIDQIQLSISALPSFTPDYQHPPGCFDLVGRGGLPRVAFTTELGD
jgi:hypothetical protein